MDSSSLLEQIKEWKAQNALETDRALIRENKKTIRHLHKQYRRATKHRPVWFGFVRTTLVMLVIFLVLESAFFRFVKNYGWWITLGISTVTIIVFVVITITVMTVRKDVTQETYSGVIQGCFGALKALRGGKADTKTSPPEVSAGSTTPSPIQPTHPPANKPVPSVEFDKEPPALPSHTDEH